MVSSDEPGVLLYHLRPGPSRRAAADAVWFIPDARSLKSELKHALHDYFAHGTGRTRRHDPTADHPLGKQGLPGAQFTDILARIVWALHEFSNSEAYRAAGPAIRQKTLFFPRVPGPSLLMHKGDKKSLQRRRGP
ncbi:hypothetical protein FQZ97_741110 [compost metagenome]